MVMTRAVAVTWIGFAAIVGGLVGFAGALHRGVDGAGGLPPSFADVVPRVNPAVVHISVVERPERDPHAGVRGVPGLRAPRHGEGSGFVIEPSGLILTNQHVISGSDRIRVRLADRRMLNAVVVGADRSTDVALIKVEAAGLPVVALGDSDGVRIGDWVCAIGNPYSFDHSVTVGVVSSKGRKLYDASFDAFIQTDAAINPGSSGGPLVNAAGEAIAISTAVSTQGQGIGFAIPINVARALLPQLRAKGRVTRGYLGVQLGELDPELRPLLRYDGAGGALVVDVREAGAGAGAGLRRYDVIRRVSGVAIEDGDHLVRTISAEPPGTVVKLDVARDGRALELHARLGDRADASAALEAERPAPEVAARGDVLGLAVGEITEAARKELGLEAEVAGVIVEQATGVTSGSDALAYGDVILEVNRKPTPDQAAYHSATAGLVRGQGAWLLVLRPRPRGVSLLRVEADGEAAGR
jgi:serine protease Do